MLFKKEKNTKEDKPLEVYASRGNNSVFFERHTVAEPCGGKHIAVIVNEQEEFGLLMTDGILRDTLHGGKEELTLAEGTARAEVIFMSKNAKEKFDWGTREKFDFEDPVYRIPIKIGVNGELEIRVGEPRKFYTLLVGRETVYDKEKLKERILGKLLSYIKPTVARYMTERNLSYSNFSQHLAEIAESIERDIEKRFFEEYGLKVGGFLIDGILFDEESKKAIAEKRGKIERKAEDEENREEREKREAKELEEREKREVRERDDLIDEREYRRKVEMRKLDIEEKAVIAKSLSDEKKPLVCLHCGTVLHDGARFCSLCGKNPTANICPKCSHENQKIAVFCSDCGTKL
ncbi:MAG: SPFH domain-containing protein [Clostridiales bacterium]|jgi:hypothetical protein|nr:SPFH domain-containing protein [Clostridiales bacterium]